MKHAPVSLIAIIVGLLAGLPSFLVPPSGGRAALKAAELKGAELAKEPGVRVLKWEDLVPPGYSADELMRKYSAKVAGIDDRDPRAKEQAAKLRADWFSAPLVETLNNKAVKLPGYIVPLEGDGKKVSEFLLVPFFGACIHVPPPPANQIVYVKTKGAAIREMFDIVWVTGTMKTQRKSSGIADAGYTLEASKVEPYR